MHGPCKWTSNAGLRNPYARGGRKRSYNHRRLGQKRVASRAEGLDADQCAAMWLLPGRTNHAGCGAAEQQEEADRSRDRRGYVRKYLPLRNVSADSRGNQSGGRRNDMSAIENVSRRRFLTGGIIAAGALVLGVKYYPKLSPGDKLPHDTNADHATLHPSVYLGIDADGAVWIVASRSEMGTTSRTTLPLIVADELDADWRRVKIEQAIGDQRYGDQNTDGSHSIRSFYDAMREAGATARFTLIQAAAQQWGVPAGECETDLHVVVHRSTNHRTDYGELARAAAKLPVPKREELKLKPKSAWRYVGKGQVSYDLEALVTGKAIYGMDARMDGMVYASVERPPVLGGKVKSYDDKEALKVAGVRQTIPIDPFQPPPAFQPL